MLSKFIDWLEFHIAILEIKSLPLYIWLLGLVMACIGQFVYGNLLTSFYNSPYNAIFKKLIVDYIDVLIHGLWIVPLVIFLYFWEAGLTHHKKNIRKICNLV